MTVIIANNGKIVPTKTSAATTTIAKALKQNDNRSNVQQIPMQQQSNEMGKQPHQIDEVQSQQLQQQQQVHQQQQVQYQQQNQHVDTAVIHGTELTEDFNR